MDPSPMQQPQTERHDHDSGRVAVPEIAELLHLQRPAAAVAAAAVVLLALLVTLVAPGVLPANIVVGLGIGVLALVTAVATAVVLDGRDPVLRGPRHLRRDGHTVLARMPGPDPVQHGGPVLAAIERRLQGRDHLGLVLTGTGSDPSELAVTLGRAAAAGGHTALVIDLRAPSAPGVADVGEGRVRLGEAARLADDRPYAWIGAGVDREAAARAAAGVARRPPRDLKLLLVVAPDAATHVPEVLRACDGTVLLVAADTQQRAMVSARLDALERAGGRPEAVVVGGLRVVSDDSDALDTGSGLDVAMPTAPAAPAVPQPSSVSAVPQPSPASAASEPEEEPEPTVPPSPAPPPVVPEPPEPDEPEPTTPPAPEPDAPPVQVPDPEAVAPDATGDLAAAPPTVDAPHDLETPPIGPPSVEDEFPATAGPDDEPTPDAADPVGADDPSSSAGGVDEPRSQHRADPLVDTGPLPPVFRTATPAAQGDADRPMTAPAGDTAMEGMAETDPLLTVAALDQLVGEQRRRRDAG